MLPFFLFAMQVEQGQDWQMNLHRSMVAVPAILLLAARFCSEALIGDGLRRSGIAAAAAAVLFTALNASYYSGIFVSGDNKLAAGEWINRNIPPGSSIGARSPFYSDYRGYPPFRQTAYGLVCDPAGEKNADFYVTVEREDELERILPGRGYAPLRTFSRAPSPLDRLFSNRLLPHVDTAVVVYGKGSSVRE